MGQSERGVVWLRQTITMPGVCVILEHHSEATVTTNRQSLFELLEQKYEQSLVNLSQRQSTVMLGQSIDEKTQKYLFYANAISEDKSKL